MYIVFKSIDLECDIKKPISHEFERKGKGRMIERVKNTKREREGQIFRDRQKDRETGIDSVQFRVSEKR